MKESARADDVVGRIGGDEFALLLGEQTAESAEPVIRRIRARVAEARDEMEISVPWELTIGMASFPGDGATLEELLDLADRQALRATRYCIEVVGWGTAGTWGLGAVRAPHTVVRGTRAVRIPG